MRLTHCFWLSLSVDNFRFTTVVYKKHFICLLLSCLLGFDWQINSYFKGVINWYLQNFGWQYAAKYNLKRLCNCNWVSLDTLRSFQSTFLVDFDAFIIYHMDIYRLRVDLTLTGRRNAICYFTLQSLADESSSSKTFTPYNKRFAAIWAGRCSAQHL